EGELVVGREALVAEAASLELEGLPAEPRLEVGRETVRLGGVLDVVLEVSEGEVGHARTLTVSGVEERRERPGHRRDDEDGPQLVGRGERAHTKGRGKRKYGGRGRWLKSKSERRSPRIAAFSRTFGRRSGRPSVAGSMRCPARKSSSMNFR